jgi:hypothetical protein
MSVLSIVADNDKEYIQRNQVKKIQRQKVLQATLLSSK